MPLNHGDWKWLPPKYSRRRRKPSIKRLLASRKQARHWLRHSLWSNKLYRKKWTNKNTCTSSTSKSKGKSWKHRGNLRSRRLSHAWVNREKRVKVLMRPGIMGRQPQSKNWSSFVKKRNCTRTFYLRTRNWRLTCPHVRPTYQASSVRWMHYSTSMR